MLVEEASFPEVAATKIGGTFSHSLLFKVSESKVSLGKK